MSESNLGRNPWLSKIAPWTAQPLTDAAKDEKLRATLTVHAERVIYGRSAIIAGWTMGGLGAAMMGVSVFGWVSIFPLKTIEIEMWLVDSSTGIISRPISLKDAPTKFGPASDQHFLHQFVLAMERWTPEIDRETDHLAKIMSSPDVQAQINDRRTKPESNAVSIGNAGHVELENFHYFPQFMDKDSQTRRYLVKFQRTVWKGSNKESSEPWTATVDFQYHPERAMIPADRDENPGGFVAIAYTADSDNKDTTRHK